MALKESLEELGHIGKYHLRSESGRAMMYRYEYDGVLVYDYYARLSTENCEVTISQSHESCSMKKDSKSQDIDYGNT